MRYLTIKTHSRKRADGRESAQAFYVHKNRKFGDVLEQTQISVKKPVLVVGAHASGKSYWLDRLRENAPRVWASRQAEPLYLAAVRPLQLGQTQNL